MATGILTANALDPRLTLQSHSATLGLTCNLVPQPPCAPPPQVDGGVSAANIAEIAEAGADMFVAGSAIFNSAPSSPRAPRPPRDAPRPPRAPSTSPPLRARALATAGFGLLRVWLPRGSQLCPSLSAAEDYKATIDGMREELAKVPFPGKAKVAA